MNTQNSGKLRLSLDDLKIESFVTSMDSEITSRLMGGLSHDTDPTHETHTERTNDFEPGHICTGVQCVPPAFAGF